MKKGIKILFMYSNSMYMALLFILIISLTLDPPGPPSKPEAVDSSYNFIKVQWKKPESDGGNPITGYLVECKELRSKEWNPCNKFPTKLLEYTANNVLPSMTYEFRVRAVNGAGAGEPSMSSVPVKAEPPVNLASPVDQPKVEEIKKDSVTLSWKRPTDDGGSILTGYVIEKKSGNGPWEEVLEVSPKNNQATVKDLKENEECQFRVKVRNDAGLSEPSQPTDVIKVQDQPKKPVFDISLLKDITVNAGKPFVIQLPFKAYPLPRAEWTNDDKEIVTEENRVEIKVILTAI